MEKVPTAAAVVSMPKPSFEASSESPLLSIALPLVSPRSTQVDSSWSDRCSDFSNDGFATWNFKDIPDFMIETPQLDSGPPSLAEVQNEQDHRNQSMDTLELPPFLPSVPVHHYPEETMSVSHLGQGVATSLNPQAAPWQPSTSAVSSQLSTDMMLFIDYYEKAVDCMVSDLAQKVDGCLSVPISIHQSKGRRVWTFICRILPEHIEYQDKLIALAKEHLWCACEASDTIVLDSFCTEPFRPKVRGFTARLSPMPDQDVACWDMYATGSCTRPCCKWQHPLRHDRFIFQIKDMTMAFGSEANAEAQAI